MPMSLQEILDRQDELAARFEGFDPTEGTELDPAMWRGLLDAAAARASSEAGLANAVIAARNAGFSWALIGQAVGTTGQAAQQRYGTLTKA